MSKLSISALALTLVMGAGLVGCSDDDVSVGAYVTGDALIYGDGYYHPHNYGYPGYYPAPVIIGGGYGGGYHGGHGGGFGGGHPGGGFGGGFGGGHGPIGGGFGGHPGGGFGGGHGGPGGGGGGHHMALTTMNADQAAAAFGVTVNDVQKPSSVQFRSKDARVQRVAANYSISDYAATYVVRAVLLAQSKDLSGLKEIGLETNDFQDLYAGRDLDADTVANVATQLKMPTVAAQALIKDLSTDIQAEQAKNNN